MSGFSIFEIDTVGFYRDDAKYIDILEDDSTEYVIFGTDCIEQMLSHHVCYACAIWTGKFKLSAKALKEKPEGYVEPERPVRGDRGPRPERRGPRPERRNPDADGARLNRH